MSVFRAPLLTFITATESFSGKNLRSGEPGKFSCVAVELPFSTSIRHYIDAHGYEAFCTSYRPRPCKSRDELYKNNEEN
jgi:hypothetical protein